MESILENAEIYYNGISALYGKEFTPYGDCRSFDGISNSKWPDIIVKKNSGITRDFVIAMFRFLCDLIDGNYTESYKSFMKSNKDLADKFIDLDYKANMDSRANNINHLMVAKAVHNGATKEQIVKRFKVKPRTADKYLYCYRKILNNEIIPESNSIPYSDYISCVRQVLGK